MRAKDKQAYGFIFIQKIIRKCFYEHVIFFTYFREIPVEFCFMWLNNYFVVMSVKVHCVVESF